MKTMMRIVIVCAILIASSIVWSGMGFGTSTSMIEPPTDFSIEKLSERIFVADHHFPWPANSLIVEMANGTVVLVDTPYTPEATEDLLGWIERQFGKRQLVAINTHFHLDNLGGNAALVEAGVPIYGSDLTVQLIGERGEEARALLMSWLQSTGDERYRNVFANLAYVPPTEVFALSEGKVLMFGEEKVVIYYPGESHAPENVVVYFPTLKLLFGSCMVKSLEDAKLGNVADANVQEWPKSVKKLMERFNEAEIIVPGHGGWGGRELLSHTLQLLEIDELDREW